MSRIGKQIIEIPAGTTVEVQDSVLTVSGKLGKLVRDIHPQVSIEVNGAEVSVKPLSDDLEAQALWGTFAAHVRNMVNGVNEPFQKQLVIEGVGYRAEMQGKDLSLNLGYSHPVKMTPSEGLEVSVEKNVITIKGADKEAVGQFAADVRIKRKPEPYKGKGIRYSDEVVLRKQGKKSV